mgnify:CR=1 FL=1
MNKKEQENFKYNIIFRMICANDVCCMNPGYPLPAKGFKNISYYMAKKLCKELKEEGLIRFYRAYIPACFSYEGELEHDAFFVCGWETTEKGRETKIYKEEEIQEQKMIKECFEINE